MTTQAFRLVAFFLSAPAFMLSLGARYRTRNALTYVGCISAAGLVLATGSHLLAPAVPLDLATTLIGCGMVCYGSLLVIRTKRVM